jgi:hypothetical protein
MVINESHMIHGTRACCGRWANRPETGVDEIGPLAHRAAGGTTLVPFRFLAGWGTQRLAYNTTGGCHKNFSYE